jgi:DNA-binding IscR family transcriptional regulator
LVWTNSGPDGGAGLAQPAESVSLLDVIEAMEGPIHLNFCRIGPNSCQYPDSDRCPIHPTWEKLNALIKDELRQTNLRHLSNLL